MCWKVINSEEKVNQMKTGKRQTMYDCSFRPVYNIVKENFTIAS